MANNVSNATTNITETTTLYELLRPLVKPAKRPTAAWLRKNATKIAERSQTADDKPHLTMNATLFGNGYGIYSSGGHTTVVWLADCLEIVYRFSFSTSGEKEADQMKIDRDVLGNLSWFQVVVLRGESQITGVLERDLHGSTDSAESENPEKGSENPKIAEENQCEDPAEKIAGATHIWGPEEKFIRTETLEEVSKMLDMLSEDAAEAYRLYHWYGMTTYEIADKLHISHQAVSKRIDKAQKALDEIVKQMRELFGIDVKFDIWKLVQIN